MRSPVLNEFWRGVRFTVGAMALVGAYHLVVWSVGRVAFPSQAEGTLVRQPDGTVVGSSLLAQEFVRPSYFHPRPSGVDFDASSTGGTNYATSNPDQVALVEARLSVLAATEHVEAGQIPSELVTASGSGLDPHIPPAAAELQAARVASARGVDAGFVRELIHSHTERPMAGFLGRARVNVLELNLALDEATAERARR